MSEPLSAPAGLLLLCLAGLLALGGFRLIPRSSNVSPTIVESLVVPATPATQPLFPGQPVPETGPAEQP